jgi:V/A-type H+/Na+-transporting ATPase subunit D
MPKIKLTKGELKRQRDALKQYNRYLPTLQLKKQQLQAEILRAVSVLEEKKRQQEEHVRQDEVWAGLLSDTGVTIKPWIMPKNVSVGVKNIAGVDIPVFDAVEFPRAEYDLFLTPLWVDAAIEALRAVVLLREESRVIAESVEILRQELRITTQRVNLFEKVKIPEAEETIRIIKIYIGDQMTNAVGRSKMAKKKIEAAVAEEVAS